MDNIYKSLNNNNVLVALVIIITFIIFFRILKQKEHFTNGSNDDESLMALQDFTKFAITGPKGEPGDKGAPGTPGEKGPRGETGPRGHDFTGAITSTGKLWLGSWGEGNSGNSLDREVQLYLGGKFGHGANGGRAGETTYKLKIDGYDNKNSLVYPIYCKDRSGNVDFYLQNRNSNNSKPKLYVGGDLFLAGDMVFESNKVIGFRVSNELAVRKIPNQAKSGNLRVEGDLKMEGGIKLGKWTIKEDSRGDLVFEHQGQIKMYLSPRQVNFNRARFGEFSLVPEGNKLSVMHGKNLCGNFQSGEFRAPKIGSAELCSYKNMTDSNAMICVNNNMLRRIKLNNPPDELLRLGEHNNLSSNRPGVGMNEFKILIDGEIHSIGKDSDVIASGGKKLSEIGYWSGQDPKYIEDDNGGLRRIYGGNNWIIQADKRNDLRSENFYYDVVHNKSVPNSTGNNNMYFVGFSYLPFKNYRGERTYPYMDYAYYFEADRVQVSLGEVSANKYPGNMGKDVWEPHGHKYVQNIKPNTGNSLHPHHPNPTTQLNEFRFILLVTKSKIYWFRVGIHTRYVELINSMYRPFNDPNKSGYNTTKDRKLFLSLDLYAYKGGPTKIKYGNSNPVSA